MKPLFTRSRVADCFVAATRTLLALAVAAGAPCCPGVEEAPTADTKDLSPAQIKAGIISKIPAYVTWPDRVWTNASSPFVIGLLGQDSFAGLLHGLMKGEKVQDRTVEVRVVTKAEELAQCQVLFVAAGQSAVWKEWVKQTEVFGLFTMGEAEDFTKSGGVFRFTGPKRKPLINVTNYQRAGLKVDARLLDWTVRER
jgi:hypothetical protein